MASVLMGRFAFYAQATILSSLFPNESSSRVALDRSSESERLPLLGMERSDPIDATAAIQDADRITALPGLAYDPGFRQYSGYLTVDEDHQHKLFYWYVESQNDPETDPVVFWTNGGPGCSGLLGFGTEHGPFYISQTGDLTPNPYSWNSVANMLYMEQPAGVGFSYSETSSDYSTGDSKVASDAFEFIAAFFKRFPERLSNPFYVSSESYGGHYIPQLTREILNRDVHKHINFKGMMVGNPYVDPYTNTITMFQAWYNRGLLPWPLYDKFNRKCRDPRGYMSGSCLDYIGEMYRIRGKGINIYALDFPVCVASTIERQRGRRRGGRLLYEVDPTNVADTGDDGVISAQATHLINSTLNAISEGNNESNDPPFLNTGDHYYPCAEQDLIRYLNRPDVVKAIHAHPDTLPWKPCSNKLDYSKKDYLIPQNKVYGTLLKTMDDGSVDLDMLIFSGDDDSVCSLAGTQNWIWDLGVKPDKEHYWEPWTVANQTAGYLTRFKLENRKSSFVFATVHGAGHEVPSYMPREALDLFRRYLQQDWEV